jgi:methylenetetrahydrofolate dehydrogenase (NADP+)/methenyltetrahydrofolate cyclohydrolase
VRWGSSPIESICPPAQPKRRVLAAIDEFNDNPGVTGYIVQLPLPDHIDQDVVLERIDPVKDADGLHPMNLGTFGESGRWRHGLTRCLAPHKESWSLSSATEYRGRANTSWCWGRGVTVGRPIGLLLTRRGFLMRQ